MISCIVSIWKPLQLTVDPRSTFVVKCILNYTLSILLPEVEMIVMADDVATWVQIRGHQPIRCFQF